MELRKLPIGVQTFKKMREENYVYVDKTEHVYNLATKGSAYFLSRPRRFGKSLLLSTLKELFEGNRELFKDLWIEDKWDWTKTNPVIHISFSSIGYQGLGLEKAIVNEIHAQAKKFGCDLKSEIGGLCLKELILFLFNQGKKVVILMDEYDKPIIDYLEFEVLPQAKINQKILKEFYSVLKDAEPYIQMLLITGVSKFTKVSVFSDLNHLNDLTLDPTYATIAGYTQKELENNFDEYIEYIAAEHETDKPTLLNKMREWYNGFSWDGINRVYNPFGTLCFLSHRTFSNYWFSTGTPTFLLEQMKKHHRFNFENSVTSGALLNKYDIDNLELVPLLFQTGYLTVKSRDISEDDIVLDYPNREVRDSFYGFLIDGIAPNVDSPAMITVKDLNRAFRNNDLETVKDIINTLFSDLPFELYEKNEKLSERFYHSLIHLLFKYLGIYIESEVHAGKGRADSIVQTPTHIYIFEFKFNKTAEEAIAQIEAKGYDKKYKLSGKKLIGIGVNFNKVEKQITGWLVKEF